MEKLWKSNFKVIGNSWESYLKVIKKSFGSPVSPLVNMCMNPPVFSHRRR